MSINREIDQDRSATRDVLAGQRPAANGVVNWLGHEIGSAAGRSVRIASMYNVRFFISQMGFVLGIFQQNGVVFPDRSNVLKDVWALMRWRSGGLHSGGNSGGR